MLGYLTLRKVKFMIKLTFLGVYACGKTRPPLMLQGR